MTTQITRNAFALEVKSLDETGKFTGYGSVFDVVDSYSDVIVKGAFKKSIKSRNPSMLWQHRSSEPIGVFEIVKEDDTGLYLEGQLNLDVQQGKEAYSLLKQGALNGLSIGYNSKVWEMNNKTGVRTLKEVDLWEVSLVTFPANTSATITSVKDDNTTSSGNNDLTHTKYSVEMIGSNIRTFEDAVRDVLGYSSKEAKIIASEGFKGLQAHRDGELGIKEKYEQLFSCVKNVTAILEGINGTTTTDRR